MRCPPISSVSAHGLTKLSGFRYPPEINIYRHGALSTAAVGTIRALTFVILAFGTLFYFPAYTYDYLYPSDEAVKSGNRVSWYTPPLILAMSFIPAVAATLAFAPWVHQIHVRIPTAARKSREEVIRWAGRVPHNTVLSISVLRHKPWPVVREVAWEDISRLPFAFTRLSNLEHRPAQNNEILAENQNSRGIRLVDGVMRRVYGRFFVNMNVSTDKSGVPGVWDEMWKQIPMQGEREKRKQAVERKRATAKPPGPRVLPMRTKG